MEMKMENDNKAPEDNFEISLRILGNEMFGMKITSQSKAKNWAFFGIITLVALVALFDAMGPSIIQLFQYMSG
jgi:hypothetical protein